MYIKHFVVVCTVHADKVTECSTKYSVVVHDHGGMCHGFGTQGGSQLVERLTLADLWPTFVDFNRGSILIQHVDNFRGKTIKLKNT